MKQLLLTLMGISMLLVAGCGNKELIECQEKLTKCQKVNVSNNELLKKTMDIMAKSSKEMQGQIATLTAENTKLKASNKDIMTKTRKGMMSQILEIKRLKAELAKAKGGAVEAKKPCCGTTDKAAAAECVTPPAAKKSCCGSCGGKTKAE